MTSGLMAVLLALGGCGAAGDGAAAASGSREGVSQAGLQDNDYPASENGSSAGATQVLRASSEENAEASSSAGEDDKALSAAFDELMDEVRDTVYPGTAGSSLHAACAGADILTWYTDGRSALDSGKIIALRDAYIASQDDADAFTDQLDTVAESICSLDTDTGKGALADSGWSGKVTWTAEDCMLVGYALMSSSSKEAAAVSDLQLICQSTAHGIRDGDTGTSLVDASYQQLSFDETDYGSVLAGVSGFSSEAKDMFGRAADSLNRDVSEKAKDAVSDLSEVAQGGDKGKTQESGAAGYYHYERLYVQRADAAILSALSLTDSYSGGAHASVSLAGCNYDPATGDKLSIDDIFSNKDALPDVIASSLVDQYPGLRPMPESRADEIASQIRAMMNDIDDRGGLQFTLDPVGVTFWFGPGDLSAYADGAQAPSVRYADLPGIIDPAFVPETADSYAVALPGYIPMIITDDSGRGFSTFLAESSPVSETGDEYRTDTEAVSVTVSVNNQQKRFQLPGITAPDYYLMVRGTRRFILINTHYENGWESVHLYEMPAAAADGAAQDTAGSSGDAATAGDGGLTAENDCGLYGHVLLNPDRFLLTTRSRILGSVVCTNLFRLDENGDPVTDSAWYASKPVSDEDIVLRESHSFHVASDISAAPEDLTFAQMSIAGGISLRYYRSDMKDSVDFVAPDNRIIRIRVDDREAYPQTVDGTDVDTLFDGIVYSG